MADIAMSYNVVGSIEEKVAFLQTGFDDFMKEFNDAIGSACDSWMGKAQTDFSAKWDSIIPTVISISDLLSKYKTALSQAVYLQQSTESSSAASAEKLSF